MKRNTLVDAMRSAVNCPVLQGDEPDARSRSRAWNKLVTVEPAVVVIPGSIEDIQACLRVSGEHSAVVQVRNTGHGAVPSRGGEVIIVLSEMNRVMVDPARRVAVVEGGSLVSDLVAVSGRSDLMSVTGYAGLGVVGFTTGGGLGWNSRCYGLSSDHLLRAELVTPNGDVVVAGEDGHGELLWCLRGGGADVGVVTRCEIRLHPMRDVFGGRVVLDLAEPLELLANYRQTTLGAERDLSLSLTLQAKDGQREGVVGCVAALVRIADLSTHGSAVAALATLTRGVRARARGGLGRIGVESIGVAEWPRARVIQRSLLFDSLSDEALAILATQVTTGDIDSGPLATIELRHWGGAIGDTSGSSGPSSCRSAMYSVVITVEVISMDHLVAAKRVADDLVCRLQPYANGRSFLNFAACAEQAPGVFDCDEKRRLKAVKRRYDPTGIVWPRIGTGSAIAMRHGR